MPLSFEGEDKWEGNNLDNKKAPSKLGQREALIHFLTSFIGYKV